MVTDTSAGGPTVPLNVPFVSVVTPVRNGGAFLEQCIESVLRQTYPRWEYVIVDNHSTDESLAVARRYAIQDARIRVLSTPTFLDAVGSQNFALRQISAGSTYCKIVHADDWLFPECVARMVELAESHPSVGIVSAYRLDGDDLTLDGLPYPSTFVSGREIARRSLLGGPYVFGSPTSLLIRSDIVRSRLEFYSDHAPWTDVDVCYEILRTWDFGFVHQVLTFTRRHDGAGSAVSGRFNAALLGSLVLLERYGREFLTEPELHQQTKGLIRQYREFLIRSAVAGRDGTFWAYHVRGLAATGHPLKFHDLLFTAAGLVVMRVLRPPALAALRLLKVIRAQVLRRSAAAPPAA